MEQQYKNKKTYKSLLDDILDIRKKLLNLNIIGKERVDVIEVNNEELERLEESPFSELETFMINTFVKYNYSPIMNKIFPSLTKETDDKLRSMYSLWSYFSFRTTFVMHKAKIDIYSKKIFNVFVNFLNKYLSHIFGISKIYEALNILNKKIKFKIYNFSKENEVKDIYLNIESELKGSGCTFIFLKELRRLYDCLIYSQNIFKMSILFNFFEDIENLAENIFYDYIIENEVVSSLLYQIKLIFENYSDDKHVINMINKFTIKNKKDLKQEGYKKVKIDIYSKKDYDDNVYGMIIKEFDEIIKFKMDINIPKKINYIYKEVKDLERDYNLNGGEIEFKEDEKIKEIKDLDELTKYIQGEKKKKKKKKKKENPINILEKLYNNNNINLDDDQISTISHDTIFSNFKADIKNDNIDDENKIKIKPFISQNFIKNLK